MKLSKNSVSEHLAAMIRFRTVSHEGRRGTDRDVFLAFRRYLEESWPAVFAAGEAWGIGDYGTLIRIPGRDHTRCSVLMAHYDVVDAEPEKWDCDPFAGIRRDGRIVGRGALDTKCTLCAILEAVNYRLGEGWTPAGDLWLSFGGEEEVCGRTCADIVAFLRDRGVRPDFVLDEGGAVIPEGLPGVCRKAAVIGIAEKGEANFLLRLKEGKGGHASVPPRHTVCGRVAAAASAIEKYRFPPRISTPVRRMFLSLGKKVPFYERPVFMHPELFAPAISAAASFLGGSFEAMVRTTAAVTILTSSRSGFNVLPSEAAVGVNVRLLEGDTVESAAAHLRKAVRDPEIEIDVITEGMPSPVAVTDCAEFRMLEEVIRKTWKGAVTAPYQMNGGTDARHFAELTDRIYRFSPMIMTKEERASVHGANESIREESLWRMVYFYILLTGEL